MKFVHISEVVDHVFENILGENANPGYNRNVEPIGRDFRFAETGVDEYAGAMKPGKIYIIAGRPGMGKTTFLLRQAIYNAARSGGPVFVFQEEMANQTIVERMIPIITGVNHGKPEDAGCDSEHKRTLENDWYALRELPIYLLPDNISLAHKMEQISSVTEGMENSLLIFDYFQLLGFGVDASPCKVCQAVRDEKAAARLQRVAERCASPVLIATQLPRRVEAREDKLPRSEDIPRSLLQVSECAVMLVRKSVYDASEPANTVTAILHSHSKQEKTIDL